MGYWPHPTENFHLVFPGTRNCKSLILRGAERAAPAALVFNISIESVVSCLEGRDFRQENEGLMRKTGISVCLVESGPPVF
jgi:hypothetical protein